MSKLCYRAWIKLGKIATAIRNPAPSGCGAGAAIGQAMINWPLLPITIPLSLPVEALRGLCRLGFRQEGRGILLTPDREGMFVTKDADGEYRLPRLVVKRFVTLPGSPDFLKRFREVWEGKALMVYGLLVTPTEWAPPFEAKVIPLADFDQFMPEEIFRGLVNSGTVRRLTPEVW